MNNKFAALSRYLDQYPDEYNQYINIVNSYYFPLLLKIAQQQLPLFEGMQDQETILESKYSSNFSFEERQSEFRLSDDEVKILDLLLSRLKYAYPEKSNDKLIEELITDFVKSRPDNSYYGGYGHAPYSIFSRRQTMVKKYFNLFPDLEWKPEFQQLKIPFEGELQTKPLGESLSEKEDREDLIRQKYELLMNNNEAVEILKNINSNNLSHVGYGTKARLKNILRKSVEDSGLESNYNELEDVLNLHVKSSRTPIYFREDIDQLTNNIEGKWKELFSLFSQADSMRSELDPGDFTPKSESEIKNFNDSIFSAAKYSVFIIKKISSNNIDVTPFKQVGYNKTGRLSDDLNSIKNNLENNKLDDDPFLDGQRKINLLDNEISACKDSIENFKKYKNLFKRLDKDIENECREYLNTIQREDLKVINWVNKYRIDIVRGSYAESIKSLAANTPSEAKRYTYSNTELSKSPSLYRMIFSRGTNQKEIMSKIVGVLSSQQHALSIYIRDYIVEKIKINLFTKCKDLFQQVYFEYPGELESFDFASNRFSIKKKEVSFTIDQIKKFIQDWNGKPNLKSFLNVILSNTKNADLLDKYLQTMLQGDTFNNMYHNSVFDEFNQIIVNFIGKSKSKTEEELVTFAVDSLAEEFLNLMKKSIADSISGKLQSSYIFRENYYDKSLNLKSDEIAPLAPNISTKAFDRWLSIGSRSSYESYSPDDASRSVQITLAKIIKRLKSSYADIQSYNSDLLDDNVYYQISSEIPNDGSFSKEDRYNIINNILNIMSPVFDKLKGQLKSPYINYERKNLPILEGGTFTFKAGPDAGRVFKLIKRPSYHSIVYEVDGEEEYVSFSNIYMAIKAVSPTVQDFYNGISSLKQKNIISNFEIDSAYTEKANEKIRLLLNEVNLPWTTVYRDMVEIDNFKEIADSYNMLNYSPDNLVNTIRAAVDEIRAVDRIYSFNRNSSLVASAFGGVGFKDISAGIENLFSINKLEGISKKEFISKISSLVNNSFKPEMEDDNSIQKMYINAFLATVLGTADDNKFGNIVAPIIKKLNLRDFNSIVQTCHQISSSSKNISKTDVAQALRALRLEGMAAAPAVERIINASSFLHNHFSLPPKYVGTIINSPNFYSDSKISQEYIDSCTALFKYGGMNEFNNPNSNVYKVVDKMVISELISNVDQFKSELNAFSKLCMKRDGIRANLGNSTAEIKLKYLIKKIVDKDDQGFNISFENYFPAWDSLTFEDKVVKIKEYVQKEAPNVDDKWDTTLHRLYYSVANGEFDKEVETIRQTASTEEQYFKDLKIKQIIQKAASNLKMLEMSSSLITYAKDAKKKDERLFNFEYNDPANLFRFRVLRNLDPYHFLVGADTGCCQRVGGYGHNAAVDSFINPLAGVLLLETNVDGSWVTASQSYFHYVPRNNGLILDNVEHNSNNIYNFFRSKKYDINILYAAFADYIKNKYNLSYVRCGEKYNKLDNSKFSGGKITGGDPRHFEYKKYSDFTASDHIDLLKPKFKLDVKFE